MGWGEYTYFGCLCDYNFFELTDTLYKHDKNLMNKVFSNVFKVSYQQFKVSCEKFKRNCDYEEKMISVLNKFVEKKYNTDLVLFHTHYHGRHDYIAVGVEIDNFCKESMIAIINNPIVDSVLKLFDIEPCIVNTSTL